MSRSDQLRDPNIWKLFQPQLGSLELHSIHVTRNDAQTEINLGRDIGAIGNSKILPMRGVWKPRDYEPARDVFGAYVERRE